MYRFVHVELRRMVYTEEKEGQPTKERVGILYTERTLSKEDDEKNERKLRNLLL